MGVQLLSEDLILKGTTASNRSVGTLQGGQLPDRGARLQSKKSGAIQG